MRAKSAMAGADMLMVNGTSSEKEWSALLLLLYTKRVQSSPYASMLPPSKCIPVTIGLAEAWSAVKISG